MGIIQVVVIVEVAVLGHARKVAPEDAAVDAPVVAMAAVKAVAATVALAIANTSVRVGKNNDFEWVLLHHHITMAEVAMPTHIFK